MATVVSGTNRMETMASRFVLLSTGDTAFHLANELRLRNTRDKNIREGQFSSEAVAFSESVRCNSPRRKIQFAVYRTPLTLDARSNAIFHL